MFCDHCGAQIPDNSKFCEQCGRALDPAPVQDSVPGLGQSSAPGSANFVEEYRGALENRLNGMGFDVKRNITASPYILSLVAQKKGVKELGFLGSIIGFVSVMPMDNPDPARITQFSDRTCTLAREWGATSHLVATYVFPVVITKNVSSETRNWMIETKMSPGYNMIPFPAIAVYGSREIVYCQRTGFLMAAAYPTLRDFSGKYLKW